MIDESEIQAAIEHRRAIDAEVDRRLGLMARPRKKLGVLFWIAVFVLFFIWRYGNGVPTP